ncbi:uncharacterized protein VTP21DRAFT_7775 [Calcarisporiella thermophila]|uniref:uncharacterized protein n=1 Tax=Calcarisporiella thermophila TaxID=911321 RepID=UPI0037424212
MSEPIPSSGIGSRKPTEGDRIVLSYLRKRGFSPQLEMLFRREANIQSAEDMAMGVQANESVPGYVANYSDAKGGDPDAYDKGYARLRRWIEDSLDLYKPELRSVLFPLFVHAYLELISKDLKDQAKHFMDAYKEDHMILHGSDIQRIASITDKQHVAENELAQLYRKNKYQLRMSRISFDLLLSFLQDSDLRVLLRLFNQYIHTQVSEGPPTKSGGLESDDVIGITSHPASQLAEFNQQQVDLGPRSMESGFLEEVESALKDEEPVGNKSQQDESTVNGQPASPSLLETFKKIKQEPSTDAALKDDIPIPPFKSSDIKAEIDALRDLRKRVSLGSGSLPSICCYTFHNTHDELNCIGMSDDLSLMAGGFSESYIKIWSLKGEKLRGLWNNINPTHVHESHDLERFRERAGENSKRLIGHSGPVFGLSFSPDNKLLLSCSEDKTARLWSLDTFSNLVVYKGHNYPVWDITFGPLGFYFATASNDRTARLWSCDHVYPLRIFAGHLSDVDCVTFHPNSKYIVTGSSDRTARLWDVQRGTCVRMFTGHTGAVHAVAVSPDGRLMASAGEDKSIMLWDLGSGRRLKKMSGHTGFIYSLDFSADGNLIASASSDCTVRLWDVTKESTEEKRRRLEGEATAAVKSIIENGIVGGAGEKAKTKQLGKSVGDDALATFPTKRTPIYKVKFTKRNLLLAAGAFMGSTG